MAHVLGFSDTKQIDIELRHAALRLAVDLHRSDRIPLTGGMESVYNTADRFYQFLKKQPQPLDKTIEI